MLKSKDIFGRMVPNDTNIFATNMIEKYFDHPDTLEDMCYAVCYADFATSYISKNVEEADIQGKLRNC